MMFWDESKSLPPGWTWMQLPDGPGPYRVMWERLIPNTGTCFRPAVKT